jgi:hypothetical protein
MQIHHSKKIFFTLFFALSLFPILSFAQGFNSAPVPGEGFNSAPLPGTSNSVQANPVNFNNAQGTPGMAGDYRPITPGYSQIFGSGGSIGSGGFEGMLARIFELSVYLTVILSVLMIIIGGVEYMGSESVFKKGEGKERIFAAISGLLIALVSILLISTILPGGTGSAFEINIFGTSSSE